VVLGFDSKGIVPPFGLKNPPEDRDDLDKAPSLPKKACNDSDFQGISGLPRL
jgi:hypothetical protein